MARPRVFLSSTFYDLRYIRADLEKFVRAIGYEPVLHERGQVPYGSVEKLEHYCYKEIDQVDIVVHIIGGRFGSVSYDDAYSISQMELKVAAKLNKQVYVFIERSVYSDFGHYKRNKGTSNLKYESCEDERILAFIEEVEALPRNNQIIQFEGADDITRHLQEQWAGLFQRFLQEQELAPNRQIAEETSNTLAALKQLVGALTKTDAKKTAPLKDVLLVNHPLFQKLKSITHTTYRVFFQDRKEMETWLTARGWVTQQEYEWTDKNQAEYLRVYDDGRTMLLKVALAVFDGAGKVRPVSADEWKDSWVDTVDVTPAPEPTNEDVRANAADDFADFEDFPGALDVADDDLPF